jgi:hypothetical protein
MHRAFKFGLVINRRTAKAASAFRSNSRAWQGPMAARFLYRRRKFIALGSPVRRRGRLWRARSGAMIGTVETDPESQARVAAFEQGLHALGWIVGRNVRIDFRFGSADPVLTQKYAAELVAMAPDVILANSPLVRLRRRQRQRLGAWPTTGD